MNASEVVAALPPEVADATRALTGRVTRTEPLRGLTGRTVAAVHGVRRSVVVKGPASASEVAVAGRLSGSLARHGVRTPEVLAMPETENSGTWIVMEHLPRPLPRERWGPDEEVIATLRRLHTLPPDVVASLAGRYRPRWDDALTAGAAAALDADDTTVDRLTALAERAQPLFEAACVVSADPNPLNWCIDDEDRPVLLDLERITVATPALDLAIVLPGLPDRAAAAAVIVAYGHGAPTTDDVLLAKAWSVVELASTASPGSDAQGIVTRLRPAFLAWLEQF